MSFHSYNTIHISIIYIFCQVVFSVIVSAVSAAPQGYSLPAPPGPALPPGGPPPGAPPPVGCQNGEVLHVDGSCVTPQVVRKLYVFNAPEHQQPLGPPPVVPPPTVEHNILFIRIPEGGQGPEPIVVPPPSQKHVVYVLNKQSDQAQRVIEVPAPPPSSPDVYFVNYNEGDNPTLPDGTDIQSALSSAVQGDGQLITGTGGAAAGGEAAVPGPVGGDSGFGVPLDDASSAGFDGSAGAAGAPSGGYSPPPSPVPPPPGLYSSP
ncbi:WAS/WASL-interacting protein family member 3-like [Procambarus clarkii]|uniref:WAS/WASL-interacting protein family member 3-like n=1 Tax=Procambarus clarkii TaxID=6728 RepID=UPI0037435130